MYIGIFAVFCILGILLIYGAIEILLDNIVYKISIYFSNKQQKKQDEKRLKKLHEIPSNFVMILNEKAKNGNLKNNMSKINIIDPKGNKLVIVFGSYWKDMKDFYIDVYDNDIGFKYVIRKSFTDTKDILNKYLENSKKIEKIIDTTLKESCKLLAEYYWNEFKFRNILLNEPNEHIKNILKLHDIKSTTSHVIDERYECERCLKKISSEEYELYDCMCEECFEDISYKDDGSLF